MIFLARFHGPLDLRLRSIKRWETLAPLFYTSKVAMQTFMVPAEFITDLASVPRLPFAYLVAGSRVPAPAVVHDWLYQHPEWDDRVLADAVFLEAMAVDQPELGFEAEGGIIRRLIWAGVRVGGWWAWRNHRKRALDLNPVWSQEGQGW